MEFELVSYQKWQEFIERLPNYEFFHLPIWTQVYEKTYSNCKTATKIFTFDKEVEVILPLVEVSNRCGFKSYESLPGGGYGGILWTQKPNKKQIKKLLKNILNLKVISLQIYPNPLKWEEIKFLENYGFKTNDFFTHILDLQQGFDWIWKNNFTSINRNAVRKAEKSGLTVKIANNIKDIESYYSLYLNSVKRWHLQESQIRPFDFFKNLFEIGKDNVKYYLVQKDEKDIAGAIIGYGSDNIFYIAGAMLKEFGEYQPNNLLIKKVVQDICENNYKYFNMGASVGLPGVAKFKESFGAEKINYKFYSRGQRLLSKIYRKLILYSGRERRK